MKRNLLVTGGCGYIGSVIASIFLKKYNVYVLDNLSNSSKKYLNKRINFNLIDLSDLKKLEPFLKKKKFSTIIHCAAKKSVLESEKNKSLYFKENILNTKNLFSVASRNGLKKFIFLSSAAVYGASSYQNTLNENLKPISFYGKTKLNAENILQKLANEKKIKLAILRLFNAAGADLKNKHGNQSKSNLDLFSIIIKSFQTKSKFNLFGNNFNTKDGSCLRNFIHIKDIANIVLKISFFLEKYKKNVLVTNVCSPNTYSVLDVIKKFEKLYKRKLKIVVQTKRKGEIPVSKSSYFFIKKFLKYKCMFSNLNYLVKSSVSWYEFTNK